MRPRPHHHGFTHRALPETLLTAAAGRSWAELLAGPAGPLLLRRVWKEVGDALPPEERLVEEGLSVTVHETTADLTLVVITLPPVLAELEAHFVALLAERATSSPKRYFTLESGSDPLTGRPATYIGTLLPDGSRGGLGAGPAPEEAAFTAALCRRLRLTIDPDRPPERYD